jgi:DNA-binding NarL/FixJ family response regulator
MSRIRVVIAEDHTLVRQGIRAMLDDFQDIEVVGEALDGMQAVESVESLNPDVLITDMNMPRLIGTQVIERIQEANSSTQVLVVSVYADIEVVKRALRSGATGYLLKNSAMTELVDAIRKVNRGEMYLSPRLSKYLQKSNFNTGELQDPFDTLTTRQKEVLKLVADGHTTNSIANILHLSAKTVEKHRTNIMSKLGIYDVPGLVRLAIKYGLVFLDE